MLNQHGSKDTQEIEKIVGVVDDGVYALKTSS